MSIILGIDPGTNITGYGIIQTKGNTLSYITSGCINIQKEQMHKGLKNIFLAIHQLIKKYKPNYVAIEKAFVAINPQVAIVLGQARGAAMVAPSLHNIPISEYTPRLIKKAVTGKGNASKEQVKNIVKIRLNLSGELQTDAADALAISICRSYYLDT
jgi:crossover junction endodeoxyribonuclease RuvC